MPGLPRVQQLDSAVIEQTFGRQETDHLLAKQQLSGARVDVGRGVPLSLPIPSPSGCQSVDMGMPSQVRRRGVDGRDHAGANPLDGGFGDELAHRAPGGAAKLAEELPAMKKVASEELGDREDAVLSNLNSLTVGWPAGS